MKTRGAWVKAIKFAALALVVSGLLLLPNSRDIAKRVHPSDVSVSPSAPNGASNLARAKQDPRWAEAYGKLPLSFEENEGQTAREVRYVSHGSGYELFLTPEEAVLALQSLPMNLSALHRDAYSRSLRQTHQAGRMTVLRMGLEGANLETKISGIDPLPGKMNYFLGNNPEHWHTNIPTYSRVKYAQVYPGVDLVFYGNQRNLEYDFVVAPGADPKAIALTLKGARKVGVDSKGNLILSLAKGQVIFQKPVLYQNVRGQRKQIEGGYSLTGKQTVAFAVSEYDRSEPLIIDPVLNYSTYLGGSAVGDSGSAIVVDSLGDAFVTGTTFSTTFPTHNGFGAGNATRGVAFVTELNPAGTALLYSTYLGGTTGSTTVGDSGHGIALDTSGNIYVAGQTFSTDFPTNSTITPLKPTSAGAAVGTSFISKINPSLSGNASLVYSSYLGGTNGTSGTADIANSVAADASGNAYVTGYTASSPGSGAANFPITATTAFQTTLGTTAGNAFLTKIDTTQNGALSLIYSTYLGGNGANATTSGLSFGEMGQAVALDSSRNAYITGTTTSTNFPTTATALQPNTAPPAAVANGTAFLTRIDTTQSGVLVYSTYLGGDVNDFGLAIAVKPNSTIAYVTGSTSSPKFPTFPANAYQATATSFPSAFVSLIDTALPKSTALNYSTFLGGSGSTAFAIAVDAAGNAYAGGLTNSTSFPVTRGAFQPTFATGAHGEGFISKINPGGNGTADLVYSTFFGGTGTTTGQDTVTSIAVDSMNNAYITGVTFSSSATFPVFPPGTVQPNLPSGATSAAFVAKLTLIPTLDVPTRLDFGLQPITVTSAPQTITLKNNTSDPIPFANTDIAFSGTNAADFKSPSNTCGPSIAAGATCTISVTFTPSVASAESATMAITVTITNGGLSSSQTFNVSLTGTGTAPAVGLMPTSLTFSSQSLNTTSTAQTVTLTNTGTGSLTINTIGISGDFAQTNTCGTLPAMLAANANCMISVTFKPTATGTRTGTLTITDNATGSPHTVTLTGTGTNTPPDFTLSAAPTTVTVARGAVSTPVTITVNPTNGFNSAVALTCAGAPAKSSCTLNPPSITPPTTSALTFTAHAMLVPLPMTKPAPPLNMLRIVPLFFVLMLLFLLRSTQRFRTRLAMVSAIIICVTLAACGSGGPDNKTAKGTYPLTITGTSGALTHNVTVTVTVN